MAPQDDHYDVWLDMLGRTSRPRFVDLILNRAGVDLDVDLVRYLVYLDLRGPIGVLDLAELVEQNHPKVSRSLAKLEDLGLVQRSADSTDRRIKTATVTEAGRRIVAAINTGRRRILDEAFADWTAHDCGELARLTRRFSDAVTAMVNDLPVR